MWIVGKWVTDSVFVAEERQPVDAIASLAAMETWARETFAELPGEYAFVKKSKGNMLLGKQLDLKFGAVAGQETKKEETR